MGGDFPTGIAVLRSSRGFFYQEKKGMKNPRSISKKTRFEVFKRDGFRCQYCGDSSEEVKLVIDHVIPVCEGGSGDPENLVTSCEPCNQGKGGRPLVDSPLSEERRLAMIQEARERKESAQYVTEIKRLREESFQDLINYWCDAFDEKEVQTRTIKTIFSYLEEHGAETVFKWIDIASSRLSRTSDSSRGKYISGIRRIEMKGGFE